MVGGHKDEHFMIKRSIHQEDMTIINLYVHYIGEPKYNKRIKTNLKGEIDKKAIIVGDPTCK